MSAIMGYAARKDPSRKIHLFDAWQGLPDTTEKDGKGAEKWVGEVVGSPNRAQQVMRKVGMPLDRVVFHKGWFHETLESADIDKIALLHIDCDFYEPTLYVLETFVPKMVSGGWVQIDDYTEFEGCRIAVNQYLERHPELKITVEDRPGGASFFRVP
jgi:O-methyltransferase